MNDYLFNPAGEADPDIKEFERVLGSLRFHPCPLDLDATVQRAADTGIAERDPKFHATSGSAHLYRTQMLNRAIAASLLITLASCFWLALSSMHLPADDKAESAQNMRRIGEPSIAASVLTHKYALEGEQSHREQSHSKGAQPVRPHRAQARPATLTASLTRAQRMQTGARRTALLPAKQLASTNAGARTVRTTHQFALARESSIDNNEAVSEAFANTTENLFLAFRVTGDKLYRTQRHLESRLTSAFTTLTTYQEAH